MAECKHPELEFIGVQKTEDGANTYMKCKICGDVVVVMPDNKAFSLKSTPPKDK